MGDDFSLIVSEMLYLSITFKFSVVGSLLKLMICPSLHTFTLDIIKYYSVAVHLRHIIDIGRDSEMDGGREEERKKVC
jgi:hypothetical protein